MLLGVSRSLFLLSLFLAIGREAQAQTNCGVNGCEPQLGETCLTCPSDCGCIPPQVCSTPEEVCIDQSPCGDGTCDPATENPQTCSTDCFCGDQVCSESFETCVSCPGDCPQFPGCETSGCECAPGEVRHPVLGICILEACLECPEGALCDLDTGACIAAVPGDFQTQGIEFLHVDALGSVRLVTDEAGGVISRHDYLPFGEEIPGDGSRAGIPGYGESPTAPIRFTGKERDVETGLDYFGARYFSGAQARFTTVDPSRESADPENPQSWNRYTYALNNPLKYVDPDGQSPKVVIAIIKVAIKGGDVYSSVSGIVEAAGTVFSTDASVGTGERLRATGSLIAEISGASDAIKGVKAVSRIDDARDAAKAADRAGSAGKVVDTRNAGTIYEVPGSATASGKPYIGRHNQPDPAKTRRSNDGRDRKEATVIDTYDTGKPREGRVKEQRSMNDKGGVENLDNKRNEIDPRKWKDKGVI
jgi:RHS repeat-associated protein